MQQRRIRALFRIEDLLGMALMLFLLGFCCFQFMQRPPTRAVSYASFVRNEPLAAQPLDEWLPAPEPTTVGVVRDRTRGLSPTRSSALPSPSIAPAWPVWDCSAERQAELERFLEACRG